MTTKADMVRRARFEAIWAEHSPKVRAYCIRRVASHDADDLCAEIFLVVWRRLDEVPPAPKTLLGKRGGREQIGIIWSMPLT